jgi:hypothetical protein
VKTKIFALIILAIIALTSIGYSYACLNGGIQVNCYPSCYCNVVFIKVRTYDNEIEKDVGKVYAQISCDGGTIQVCINNSYPCYKAYINFTIRNKGSCPVHIDEVTIQDYNSTALEIEMTNIIACTWISPCETINGLLTVHTLQEAQEYHTYTFKVIIKVSCETERHPHTIDFWQNQFSKALCKNGNPQVPPATLEHYLDLISSQSPFYEFTGNRTQKFKQALNILSPSTHSSMEAKLKAQLLALWLNYVAGWTDGYKVDGKTAWDIIQGSEYALLHLTSDYRKWKDLCDRFNNLGE